MYLVEIFKVLSKNNIFVGSLIISFMVVTMIILIYYARKKLYKKMKHKKGLTSEFLMKFETPIILFTIVLSAEVVLAKMLNDYVGISITIQRINTTLIIIAITYTLMLFVDLMLQRWSNNLDIVRRNKAHQEVLPLLKSIKNILMTIIATLLILQAWGVRIGAIATSIGVAGVILGFVYKDTLANIFNGISLIMDDSFQKGDLIELNDGEIGYVEEINLRSTKLRNFGAEEVIIPNSMLANMKIKNFAHPTKAIRLRIEFSVALDSDPDKVTELIFKLIKSSHDVLKYPKPKIFFQKIGEYYLNFAVLFFIPDYNKMYVIKSEMTKKIYKELIKNKINMPSQQRIIYYGDKKGK
mgnify:CR=1 FL=1